LCLILLLLYTVFFFSIYYLRVILPRICLFFSRNRQFTTVLLYYCSYDEYLMLPSRHPHSHVYILQLAQLKLAQLLPSQAPHAPFVLPIRFLSIILPITSLLSYLDEDLSNLFRFYKEDIFLH
jgi:hypothetical protein